MNFVKQYTNAELEKIGNSFNGLSEQTYRNENQDPEGYTPFGDE
tara:strand:+ start:475 stop:606 length:132 start_codon:yes stop_codon:yes gene_type:complete